MSVTTQKCLAYIWKLCHIFTFLFLFFCATEITTKIQVSRFNKCPKMPSLKPVRFSTSVYFAFSHTEHAAHILSQCLAIFCRFLEGLCKRRLHSIISFFSLQFRTKRTFHFNSNLSSGQNAMHTFKKKKKMNFDSAIICYVLKKSPVNLS